MTWTASRLSETSSCEKTGPFGDAWHSRSEEASPSALCRIALNGFLISWLVISINFSMLLLASSAAILLRICISFASFCDCASCSESVARSKASSWACFRRVMSVILPMTLLRDPSSFRSCPQEAMIHLFFQVPLSLWYHFGIIRISKVRLSLNSLNLYHSCSTSGRSSSKIIFKNALHNQRVSSARNLLLAASTKS